MFQSDRLPDEWSRSARRGLLGCRRLMRRMRWADPAVCGLLLTLAAWASPATAVSPVVSPRGRTGSYG